MKPVIKISFLLLIALIYPAVVPAQSQSVDPATIPYPLVVRDPSQTAYPVIDPLDVAAYSEGRIILYVGEDILDIEGAIRFLTERGWSATIAYPSNAPGPLQIRADQFGVFANSIFGGIYIQDDIDGGVGAEIEIFARNSGVPQNEGGISLDALK